jgi:hypothetical protein
MPPALAVAGILLILVAIPFGMMLAPLLVGVIIVAVALRRLGPDMVARATTLPA